MDEQTMQRKRPAGILTKDNWETWFMLLETHLRSKGVFYIVEKTKEEYAKIQRYTPQSRLSDDLVSDILNQEKAEKYEADKSTALYNIVICLSRLDLELIEEKVEMRDKQTILKTKYKRVLLAKY